MNLKQLLKSEDGLTLVEIIAAVLILSLVTISIYGIYDYSMNSYKWGGEYASNQEEGRFVMDKVTKSVKNGFDVYVPPDNKGSLEIHSDGIPIAAFDTDKIWYEQKSEAGRVYLESPAPFALVKPTVEGYLQVEANIDFEQIPTGAWATIDFVAPLEKTVGESKILTPSGSLIRLQINNSGLIKVVNEAGVPLLDQVQVNPTQHRVRLGVRPQRYDGNVHKVNLYVNGKLLKTGQTVDFPAQGSKSLAFIRYGFQGATPDIKNSAWKDLLLFYNTYRFYTEGSNLLYEKNEEGPDIVAERVYSFEAVKKETAEDSKKANLVDLNIVFKDEASGSKGGDSTYKLHSSVKYQGR